MPIATATTVDGFRVEATTADHAVTFDEKKDLGGTGLGITPMEALAAALAGCAVITMTMYARRKGWPLAKASVTTKVERGAKPGEASTVVQTITLEGPLDEEQRQRLKEVAGKCPVHRVVEGPTQMEDRLA